ncbi:hypothetical protein C8Q75DRAFT_736372 [Abortiporus biennis]|nr:hypothetical protein C8Q75DRAFT_736372 [Abortiporus biennis]
MDLAISHTQLSKEVLDGLCRKDKLSLLECTMKETYERYLVLLSHRNASLMISQLPHEILSEVFLFSIEKFSDGLRFSYVCRHWRKVALDTPRLWSTVPSSSSHMAQLFVSRSRSLPLTMFFEGGCALDDIQSRLRYVGGYRDTIAAAKERIRSLHFDNIWLSKAVLLLKSLSQFCPCHLTRLKFTLQLLHDSSFNSNVLLEFDECFHSFSESLDRVGCKLLELQTTNIHALPLGKFRQYSYLETLHMKRYHFISTDLPNGYTAFPRTKLMEVFNQFSSLAHLNISNAGPRLKPHESYHDVSSAVYLPALETLFIEYNQPQDIAYVLAILTFPGDVTLTIDCCYTNESYNTLSLIFPRAEHRSSINGIIEHLHTLSLGIDDDCWTIECFSEQEPFGSITIITTYLEFCDDESFDHLVWPLSDVFSDHITTLKVSTRRYYYVEEWRELFSSFANTQVLWCDFAPMWGYRHNHLPKSDHILQALSQFTPYENTPCLQLKQLHINSTKLGEDVFLDCLKARNSKGASRLELLKYSDVYFDPDAGLSLEKLPDLSLFVDKFEVTQSTRKVRTRKRRQ